MVMHIILGLMYIMMAIACLLLTYWIIDDHFLSEILVGIIGGISAIIMMGLIALAINQFINAFSDSNKSEQYVYPAREYRLSIKTDTTYVIQKLNDHESRN